MERKKENSNKNIYKYFLERGEDPEELIRRGKNFLYEIEEELKLRELEKKLFKQSDFNRIKKTRFKKSKINNN
jgi:hypothetical protein